MRLGGLARYVIELETVEDVEKAYLFAKERQLPVFILGTGSNVIGKDEGFKGVILLNRIKGIRFIYYTSKKWGDSQSYHLTLDSGKLGIDGCIDMILKFREILDASR